MADSFYVYFGEFDKETARAEIKAISPTLMTTQADCEFIRVGEEDIKDIIDGLRPVSYYIVDGSTDTPRFAARNSIVETVRTLRPYLIFANTTEEPEVRVVLDRRARLYRVEMPEDIRNIVQTNKGCWNGVRFVGLTLFVVEARNPAYVVDSFKIGPQLLVSGEVTVPMPDNLPEACTIAAPRLFERISCEEIRT